MFEQQIINLLKKQNIKNITLETPPSLELGDYAFPCFSLSKKYKKAPDQIAIDISKKLKTNSTITKIQPIGPYINFFINKNKLSENILKEILKEKNNYGKTKSKKQTIMIEFSQPNTHKAFHVGHIRGTSLGESLSRILEFTNNKIIRANYSGDTGMHIAKWLWCYQKYHKNEKLKDNEAWIASIYVDAVKRLSKNEKLQEEVNIINKNLEQRTDKKLNELWKKTRILSINSWKKIYKELDTTFNKHYFESQVEKRGVKISQDLVKKQIAEISDEATIMNLEKYNLGVWVLLRKDQTPLYSAKDLALAEQKKQDYKINKYITITGDEQNLYFQQLFKTLELLKFDKLNNFKHIGFGMIRLPHGKMSSRTGDNVLYSDFLNEIINHSKKAIKERFPIISKTELENRALSISIAAIKYSFLKQDSNKTIIFNPKESISFEGNTGPYLQYAHARANSILEKSKQNSKFEYSIEQAIESELIKKLQQFPKIIQKSSQELKPNLLANYVYELSQQFNEFYHSCPVIQETDKDTKNTRIAIVKATKQVINTSLILLGIKPLDKM